jgi:hypothetical protein
LNKEEKKLKQSTMEETMKIHEVIEKDPLYQKFSVKYNNPLIAYYSQRIPEKPLKEFFKQATLDEIALYFFGYCHVKSENMPTCLVALERSYNWKIPYIDNILTPEYWEKWSIENTIAIMDQSQIFGKG